MKQRYLISFITGVCLATYSLHSSASGTAYSLSPASSDIANICFASGQSRNVARKQFNQQCGGKASNCVSHRNQWLCASDKLVRQKRSPSTNNNFTADSSPLVPGLSLVAQWNELALDAVRAGKAKPTLTAYQLFMVSTAMYDAMTAYTKTPAPFALAESLKRPQEEMTLSARREAISQAAYKALVFLFPAYENRYGYFHGYLTSLGYKPVSGNGNNVASTAHPSGLGWHAVAAYINERRYDGSNFLHGFKEGSSLVYPDPYSPVNSPDPIADAGEFGADFNPNRWQPLRVPNGTVIDSENKPIIDRLNIDSFGDQGFLSPHWGGVTPFALSHGAQLRPSPPPIYGSDEPYTDALGVESTGTQSYVRQIDDVISFSANLNDREKIIAEFWADGPRTESPPGHWNQLAHGVIERDKLNTIDSVKLFFALNAALLDASISTWEAKRFYDYVRPASAIRWYYQNKSITAWGGPNQGARTIQGETWSPYQKLDFVTPPFPEYVSGHSTFSRASAEILIRFTGSNQFYDGVTRTIQDVNGDGERDVFGEFIAPAGSFFIEEGPAHPVVLRWNTFLEAANEAGISRLYGGIHIQDGDLRGRELGEKVGALVYDTVEAYFSGDKPQ